MIFISIDLFRFYMIVWFYFISFSPILNEDEISAYRRFH